MRARYSAFALGDPEFLLASWHPSTRPLSLELEQSRRWIGLEIVGRAGGGLLDATGTVEFRASYIVDHARDEQHENSRFERVDRLWYYLAPVG